MHEDHVEDELLETFLRTTRGLEENKPPLLSSPTALWL